MPHLEAVVRRCSIKMFLKISQNSQEKNCVGGVSFYIKVAGLKPATVLKRDFDTGVFL